MSVSEALIYYRDELYEKVQAEIKYSVFQAQFE